MLFEVANLMLSVLTIIALIIYAYFTYLIAKDVSEPFVSFTIKQIPGTSHLNFSMINKSKLEVEVFGKLWAKTNEGLFNFKDGSYGGGKPWILQPFTESSGHFELKEITNENGKDWKIGEHQEYLLNLKEVL
jgi:hypothetical protein|tara:strand:- start:4300 stop:4695 length:396 start_codon:yes stop_codon:yes gene_type:complete